MIPRCIRYYNTLNEYCTITKSKPMITAGKHMLIVRNNRPLICHYDKENGQYSINDIVEYVSFDKALDVMRRFI